MVSKFLANSVRVILNKVMYKNAPICRNLHEMYGTMHELINAKELESFDRLTSSKIFRKRRIPQNIEVIEPVKIGSGKFKYLLISVLRHRDNGYPRVKSIVRGCKDRRFHDVLSEAQKEAEAFGLEADHKGGGIIKRDTNRKTMHIYGMSNRFGRADHRKAALILRKRYPYYRITYEKKKSME